MADIISFSDRHEEALSRYKAAESEFEQGVVEQIQLLRDLHEGCDIKVHDEDGRISRVPYSVFFDALEAGLRDRLYTGKVKVDFEEEEDGRTAHVILLKRSIKPKKPKSTDILPAMPVRRELLPEELEERRIKREAMKAERLRQRAKQLAFLRDQYGEDQAQAYAALMGWR
jgi:hypothetical protein